jgi:HPt (histidine-containing phosphotransfer) domain-containing protein
MDTAWQPNETLSELVAAGFAEAVAELIQDFRQDTAMRLNRLRMALHLGELVAVRKEAHSIKGSALQMGAAEVATLARRIEAAEAINGVYSDFERLESALEESYQGMRAYLEGK